MTARLSLPLTVMLMVGACSSKPDGEEAFDGSRWAFTCDEIAFDLQYSRDVERALLEAGGRRYILTQQRTASGARYGDGKGTFVWSKGRQAQFELAGKPYSGCIGRED
ncbi:lysozyme inhibitor [Rhodospirillaceae bacterium KN72]|uniref:Lysozyme inhibitor n=1 Tax=Pacificispira spongiicola TaxID=2729598 RepID=A0A7Y0DWN9_9PROT|nr:MliC family protein [Pacificispira spongiicola]NMM42989.1 lysozyme inhibitor [Pacificispira spongiicola]